MKMIEYALIDRASTDPLACRRPSEDYARSIMQMLDFYFGEIDYDNRERVLYKKRMIAGGDVN